MRWVRPTDVDAWLRDEGNAADPRGDAPHPGAYYDYEAQRWRLPSASGPPREGLFAPLAHRLPTTILVRLVLGPGPGSTCGGAFALGVPASLAMPQFSPIVWDVLVSRCLAVACVGATFGRLVPMAGGRRYTPHAMWQRMLSSPLVSGRVELVLAAEPTKQYMSKERLAACRAILILAKVEAYEPGVADRVRAFVAGAAERATQTVLAQSRGECDTVKQCLRAMNSDSQSEAWDAFQTFLRAMARMQKLWNCGNSAMCIGTAHVAHGLALCNMVLARHGEAHDHAYVQCEGLLRSLYCNRMFVDKVGSRGLAREYRIWMGMLSSNVIVAMSAAERRWWRQRLDASARF